MQEKKEIIIDGRHGEGGGQIVRTALTLAALCNVPLSIHDIRGNRKKPGLRPQHLLAVNALATITDGKTAGAVLGSDELMFIPGTLREGKYRFDIGTAGSTGLVLQAILPVLLFGKSPSLIQITGGTHVPWSPAFHYLEAILLPVLKKMGGDVVLEIDTWGWYPRGGGRVKARINNAPGLTAIRLFNRGALDTVYLLSAVSNLPLSIAERQRDHASKRIAVVGVRPTLSTVDAPSPGSGTVLFLAAEFQGGSGGFTSLGKRGKKAEAVADEACNEFFDFLDSRGTVDLHLADQLVLYMALGRGRSTVITQSITKHLLTNVWVIEQFLPVTFDIEKETGKITVDGIGFSRE